MHALLKTAIEGRLNLAFICHSDFAAYSGGMLRFGSSLQNTNPNPNTAIFGRPRCVRCQRALRGALWVALWVGLCTAGLGAGTAAWAGDDHDHDRARAAMQAGQVMPLTTLLQKLGHSDPGEVLEVDLEPRGGRWIYEVKLLQPGGRLRKLKIDAQSGDILREKLKMLDDQPAANPLRPTRGLHGGAR